LLSLKAKDLKEEKDINFLLKNISKESLLRRLSLFISFSFYYHLS
jgi:hypothetical protein